ncbi:MAG: hypothetical protein RSG48_03700 [Clostridia bacterium]
MSKPYVAEIEENFKKIDDQCGVLTLIKTNMQECLNGNEIQLTFDLKSNTTKKISKFENTIKCLETGRFLMVGKISFAYNDLAGGKSAKIKLNGVEVTSTVQNNTLATCNLSAILELKANDSITFHVSASGATCYPDNMNMFMSEI